MATNSEFFYYRFSFLIMVMGSVCGPSGSAAGPARGSAVGQPLQDLKIRQGGLCAGMLGP